MISCPGCGQSMRFDPKLQKLYCDYCDTQLEPTKVNNGKEALESDDPCTYETNLFTCPQCGGEMLSDQDTAITFCSYCGGSIELSGRVVKMAAPSKVIPFQIDQKDCKNKYAKFIKSALFAPAYLRQDDKLDKIRGIYMPYWNYEFSMNDTLTYDTKITYSQGSYRYTDYYELTITPHGSIKGISFDASSSFSDELSEAIAPFDLGESKPFSTTYLSGFYADSADVSASVYTESGKEIVAEDIDSRINSLSDFKEYNLNSKKEEIKSMIKEESNEMTYCPVYFLANTHENGKISYAVMNGQTGTIAADIPIDYKKYLFGSLILALPIFLLLNLFLVLRADYLTLIAMIFAIISFSISLNELKLLHKREYNLLDKGLASLQEPAEIKKTKVFQKWFPVLCKPVIAVIISLILLFVKPFQDEIYYFASFVIMAFVIFTFYDIVKLHNQLTLRIPKQFNKRGGDESCNLL